MQILVLNGSPHPNGNIAAMVEAFAQGAQEAGHQVTVLSVAKMKIAGCLGCEYCHTKGNGSCIQKDEMQQVYEALEQAQMLVLASPIYFYTLSAQLQAALHRTYAIGKPNVEKTALLLSAGDRDADQAAILQYKNIFSDYFHMEDAGIVSLYGNLNKDPAELEKIRAFGRSL